MPAGSKLHGFWCQLAAVKELSKVDSGQLLEIGDNAYSPLDVDAGQGRLIVRRCYNDLAQQLEHHFSRYGRSFIIAGNAGKGYGSGGMHTECHPVFGGRQ